METEHWLVEPYNQWSQLFSKQNWYTWTIFQIEFEREDITYGYEFIFIVLGLGVRIRYNTDASNELFAEWKEQHKETKK